MGSSEKSRLIQELIEASRRLYPDRKVRSEADILAMLQQVRRETMTDPQAPRALANLTDEQLLRELLAHLTHDPSKSLTKERKEMVDSLEKAKKLCYNRRFDEARQAAQRCEELAIHHGEKNAQAWALQYLGRIERDSGQLDAAMPLYETALKLSEQVKDDHLTSVIYDQIGTVFLRRHELDQAQTYFNMAVATAPEKADFAMANLAILENLRGNLGRAEAHDAEARRNFKQRGDHRNESGLLVRHSEASLNAGNYGEAAGHAFEACRIAATADYQTALDNAVGLLNTAVLGLFKTKDGFERIQKLVEVTWRPEEWELQRLIFLNLAMTAKDATFFPECVFFAWLAVCVEKSRGINTLVKQFKGGFFRRGLLAGLDSALRADLDACIKERNSAAVGRAKLNLAYCKACLGSEAEALLLAKEALTHFAVKDNGNEPRRIRQLCKELAA